MSLTPIVLADGESIPVDHTFTEVSSFPIALLAERLGVAIGQPQLSISQSAPSAKRKSQKTTLRLTIPVLETITGDVGGYAPTPRVAYTMWMEATYVSPDRCTLQQRKNLYALSSNAVAAAWFQTMIEDQTPAS